MAKITSPKRLIPLCFIVESTIKFTHERYPQAGRTELRWTDLKALFNITTKTVLMPATREDARASTKAVELLILSQLFFRNVLCLMRTALAGGGLKTGC